MRKVETNEKSSKHVSMENVILPFKANIKREKHRASEVTESIAIIGYILYSFFYLFSIKLKLKDEKRFLLTTMSLNSRKSQFVRSNWAKRSFRSKQQSRYSTPVSTKAVCSSSRQPTFHFFRKCRAEGLSPLDQYASDD